MLARVSDAKILDLPNMDEVSNTIMWEEGDIPDYMGNRLSLIPYPHISHEELEVLCIVVSILIISMSYPISCKISPCAQAEVEQVKETGHTALRSYIDK